MCEHHRTAGVINISPDSLVAFPTSPFLFQSWPVQGQGLHIHASDLMEGQDLHIHAKLTVQLRSRSVCIHLLQRQGLHVHARLTWRWEFQAKRMGLEVVWHQVATVSADTAVMTLFIFTFSTLLDDVVISSFTEIIISNTQQCTVCILQIYRQKPPSWIWIRKTHLRYNRS